MIRETELHHYIFLKTLASMFQYNAEKWLTLRNLVGGFGQYFNVIRLGIHSKIDRDAIFIDSPTRTRSVV